MFALRSIFFPRQINAATVATLADAQSSCAKLILVTEIAFSAMQSFVDRKFKHFDALVGETSCQLRAARVQELAKDEKFVQKCSLQLQVLARISGSLRKLYKELIAPGSKTQEAVFHQALLAKACKDLFLKFGKDDEFLILSHALFATRDHIKKSITAERNLAGFLPPPLRRVTERECVLIANKAKRELADASVAFIQAKAKAQSVTLGHLLKKSIVSSCDLPCAPCFFTIEVLLRNALLSRLPIAVKVERVGRKGLFIPLVSLDGRSFSLMDVSNGRKKEPVLLFEGVSSSKEEDEVLVQQLIGKKRKANPLDALRDCIKAQGKDLEVHLKAVEEQLGEDVLRLQGCLFDICNRAYKDEALRAKLKEKDFGKNAFADPNVDPKLKLAAIELFRAAVPTDGHDFVEEYPQSRIMQVLLMNASAHAQYAGSGKELKISFLERVEPIATAIAGCIDPLKASLQETTALIATKCNRFDVQSAEQFCEPANLAELVLLRLRIEALKKRAVQEGCVIENPALFVIKHIQCSRVGDEINGRSGS